MSSLCKEMARMGRGFSNENRYRILEAVMKKSQTVGQIAKKVGLPQPAVSQHLKILKSFKVELNLINNPKKHWKFHILTSTQTFSIESWLDNSKKKLSF